MRRSLLTFICLVVSVSVQFLGKPVFAQSTTVGSPSNPGALGQAIVNAYNAGYRTITIAPGTYLLPDISSPMCQMNGWSNATIVGTGVTLINTDSVNKSDVFDLVQCNNITINGGTISETVMPCCQGHIIAIGPTASDGDETLDVNFDAGYPVPPTTGYTWLNGVDQNTLQFKAGSGDYYDCTLTPLGGSSYQVDFGTQTVPMVPGDIVFGRQGGTPLKVEVYESQSCTVENLTLLRNGFAAIFEHECPGGDHFLNITWAQGPVPTGGAYAPVFCCAADGLHSVDQHVGPDIEGCEFDGLLQDDCFAIHGGYQTVTAVSGNTATVDGGYAYLMTGAIVRIVAPNFFATGTITGLVNNSNGTQTVTLDQNYNIPVGAGISNPAYCGPGYKIINNILGGTRSRGIIAKTDNGLIEDNTISGTLGPGILIGDGTAGNGEAGYSQNVTIQGNTFLNEGVYPAIQVDNAANVIGNANTTIENNTFQDCAGNQIAISGDNGAVVENNTYQNTYLAPAADRNEIDVYLSNNVSFTANLFNEVGPYANSGLVSVSDSTDVNGAMDGVYNIDNHYNFQCENDGLYIDAPDSSTGSVLDQQAYTTADQQWDLSPVADDPGYFTLQSVGGGELYSTVSSTTAGADIYQEDQSLVGSAPSPTQLWSMVPVDNSHVNIVNASTGYVINVIGQNTSPGANLCQWYSGSASNQNWSPGVVVLPNGNYTLLPCNATNTALAAVGGGTVNGTPVQILQTSGGSNQSWTFTNEGGNVYKIQPSYDSALCLDVAGDGTANGTLVDLNTDNGGGNGQRFEVIASPGGGYQILPLNIPASRVEALGSGTSPGTQVDISIATGAPNQNWNINLTGGASQTYSLTATPSSLSLGRGATGLIVVQATGAEGFQFPASLSVSGLPSGVTGSFSQPTITGSTESTLTLVAAATAVPGSYTVTISSAAGSAVETTTLALTIPSYGGLGTNDMLEVGQYVASPSGLCYLIQQGNGDLVLYSGSSPASQGPMIWQSGYSGATESYVTVMQNDGNLVTYIGTMTGNASQAVWDSGTYTGSSYVLSVLDSKVIQILSGSSLIWQRPTAGSIGTSLSVYSVTAALGQSATLTAALTSTSGGSSIPGETVLFSVDGTSAGSAITTASGVASCSFTVPLSDSTGSHTITATFAAIGGYVASTGTGTLTATIAPTTVSGVPVTVADGANASLVATLATTTGGVAIAGKSITFGVDGTSVGSTTTNSAGTATFVAEIGNGNGNWSSQWYTATFGGNTAYAKSTATVAITLTNIPTTVTVAPITGVPGQAVTLSATLSSASGGFLMTNRTITFNLDGKVIGTGFTNTNGVGTLTYKLPTTESIGTHSLTVTYVGDSHYNAASGTGVLTVS